MDPFKKFNTLAIEFLSKMAVTFPHENKITEYKFLFETIQRMDYKKPVEMFMASVEPYGLQVMSKDENFFKTSKDVVVRAESLSGRLGLIDVWESTSPETKNSIWTYLQSLYVIGMKAMGLDDQLKMVIKQVTNN